MKTVNLSFNLLGYWHIGSGAGSGATLDALVLRDDAGLPFIPGRSVKGLLRESVQQSEDFGQLQEGTTATLFGAPGLQDDRFGTRAGHLLFSNAAPGDGFRSWAQQQENRVAVQQLYREMSMTAIDADGLARKHSLRRIELTVPVCLKARVQSLPGCSADWIDSLKLAVPLLRRLGSHRSRGFGRVAVSVEEVPS